MMMDPIEGIEVARAWHDPCSGKIYAGSAGNYSAQVLDVTQIDTIKAKVILEEVLGLARPAYNLDAACRIVKTPELMLSLDVATKLAGTAQVKPLEEVDVQTEGYTRTEFDLEGYKNVAHGVISDEARLKAAHDILRLHLEDAAREIAKMRNDRIATVLQGATEITGADWSAKSGTPPQSANDPFDDAAGIPAALDAIWSNGYEPNFMAVNPLVWGTFVGNTFVKDLIHAGVLTMPPGGVKMTLPGFPTVNVIVDSALPNTSAFIGSTQAPAVLAAEGPTETAKYRNEAAGYDAFVVRQWFDAKIVVAGALRELTGVRA